MADRIDLTAVATAAVAAGAAAAASDPRVLMDQEDVGQVVKAAEPVVKEAVREAQATVDYLTNNESLPQSWSFNTALTTVVSSALGIYGALSDGYDPSVDNLVLTGLLVSFISGVTGIYARVFVKKPIGA